MCKIMVAIAVIGVVGGVLMVEGGQSGLLLEVVPEKSQILSGEPCVLRLTVSNKTDADIELDFGAKGIGSYSFRLLDEGRNEVSKGARIQMMGISKIEREVIHAGESIERRLLLNQWCPTLLPEGAYTVVCLFESRGQLRLVGECPIRIVVEDNAKLVKVFSDILVVVLNEESETKKSFATDMIALSGSPYALDPLVKLASTSALDDNLRVRAITGIERIGTLEAAKELIELTKNLNSTVKEKAIASIYRLCDRSGRPEIAEACKEITSTCARPKERRIRD